ncbi:hypothetical protein RBSH_03582 [Rhodopirellula baltica SH28]|uniref:Uncharacterized protein n=4 Tax=Rhodopirellula TaxID=265488 RepID=M2AXG8_9BACT|nr:hypothetical protein RBSH_03582 [Rhodopirellula baltica SH28]ELP32989.1 hypothetical protein RBSWK_03139 [Rhodopirellula baltica SWK14]EMB17407.1 hypothetical protein RE6C_01945 [Rhodopirellula europaea 6C]EMI25447.1 hypothetical protein RESH_03947 [Rhodopirellula europaea SH398]
MTPGASPGGAGDLAKPLVSPFRSFTSNFSRSCRPLPNVAS